MSVLVCRACSRLLPPCPCHAGSLLITPLRLWLVRYALLGGGKRVRPALCLAACELVGGAALF